MARGVGIEKSHFLTEVARCRHQDIERLEFLVHDFAISSNLEYRSGTEPYDFDADLLIANRVLQHLPEPQTLFANVKPNLRYGARIILSDVDWTRFKVTHPDLATTNMIIDSHVNAMVNPAVGGNLCALLEKAGFKHSLVAFEIDHSFRDFELADILLSLSRSCARLVNSGEIPRTRANEWLSQCRDMQKNNDFYASVYQAIAYATYYG